MLLIARFKCVRASSSVGNDFTLNAFDSFNSSKSAELNVVFSDETNLAILLYRLNEKSCP